ncbi:hypothetical protein ASG68_04440 [Rhizobium sp. Leaf453]|nr:hypothetical protein ASG50_08570 [Rhizobium sp. Leaf386]KQS90615.1 hypothetical protein ASG42_08720 [Rhizobium sp. Leaf391]KQU10224.1 hypothetical protein ASG68_04440 [Rhizobium sp. Leaf453]
MARASRMVRFLFSPAGRSAERMRGDEGGFGEAEAKRQIRKVAFGPPHPAFGHLLPAGEKRTQAANSVVPSTRVRGEG